MTIPCRTYHQHARVPDSCITWLPGFWLFPSNLSAHTRPAFQNILAQVSSRTAAHSSCVFNTQTAPTFPPHVLLSLLPIARRSAPLHPKSAHSLHFPSPRQQGSQSHEKEHRGCLPADPVTRNGDATHVLERMDATSHAPGRPLPSSWETTPCFSLSVSRTSPCSRHQPINILSPTGFVFAAR